jgi:predicted dehydrogenase
VLLLEKELGAFLNVSTAAYGKRTAEDARLLGPEIMEFGVHFVDLAKWIAGEVVRCQFSQSAIDGVRGQFGNAVAVFDHRKGPRSILCFSLAGGKPVERCTAIADRGTCETSGGMYGKSSVTLTSGERVEKFQSSPDVLEAGGFLEENRQFVEAVRKGRPLPDVTKEIIDTLDLAIRWAGADTIDNSVRRPRKREAGA